MIIDDMLTGFPYNRFNPVEMLWITENLPVQGSGETMSLPYPCIETNHLTAWRYSGKTIAVRQMQNVHQQEDESCLAYRKPF